MAGSRGPTPLFEVMAKRGQPEGGSPAPRADRGPAERDRSVDRGPARSSGAHGRISLPIGTVYAAVAVVLLACLLTFMVGYNVGFGRAESELADRLSPLDVVPLVDPLLEDPAGTDSDDRGSPQRGRSSAQPAAPSENPPRSAVGSGAQVLTAAGPGGDPRLDGHNYLELAVLSRPQAEAAVGFLAGAGVESIAVPVDPSGRGTNNQGPGRFRVVAVSLGIPSGRYSAMGGERRAFEQRLRTLGRRWVSEGGASDFRDPLWRRFER
ncbi:MAG: hypothetical protein AAF297_10795 [Planctomycetota bacterium]